jgi:hypothetical protein
MNQMLFRGLACWLLGMFLAYPTMQATAYPALPLPASLTTTPGAETVCTAICEGINTVNFANPALAESQFSCLLFAAEGRIGGASTYELDIHRVSPFAVFPPTQNFAWVNGRPTSFTVTYTPTATGINRFVFVMGTGEGQQTLRLDPQNPPSGAAFTQPADGFYIFTRATNTNINYTASIRVGDLVLNGQPVDAQAFVPLGGPAETDNLIIRTPGLSAGFILTGSVTMSWVGTTPTQSNINFGVKLGKLTQCGEAPGVQVRGGKFACSNSTYSLSATVDQANVGYIWTGPSNFSSTAPAPTASAAGTYTVVVRNNLTGCRTTRFVSLTCATEVDFLVVDPVVCDPATNIYTTTGFVNLLNTQPGLVTLTDNGVVFSVQSVTTGQTTLPFSATGFSTGPDIHTIVASVDALSASTTYTVPMPCTVCSFSVSIGGALSACAGETVVLTASAGADTYLWNTGETTSSITVGQSGTYRVTAINYQQCRDEEAVTVTIRPAECIPIVGSRQTPR